MLKDPSKGLSNARPNPLHWAWNQGQHPIQTPGPCYSLGTKPGQG